MTEHAMMPAPAQAQQEIGPPLQHRKRIPLASPIIDAEMKEAALSALENEKLVMGESVHKFEEEFARFCGTKYAVSTGSGTAALSITLQALGISHGSEVVTTPFSFYPAKNMTVGGDGGMITTDNAELAEAAGSIRDCGRDKNSKYYMGRIGYTSRLNSVNAAIGRVQLRRLDSWNEARRRLAALYRRHLEGVDGIVLPPSERQGEKPVYHLFVIRTRMREQVKKHLEKNGIETGVHYPVPIHLQTPYRQEYGYMEGAFPLSESLSNEVLSLPMYPTLQEDDVVRICNSLKDSLKPYTGPKKLDQ